MEPENEPLEKEIHIKNLKTIIFRFHVSFRGLFFWFHVSCLSVYRCNNIPTHTSLLCLLRRQSPFSETTVFARYPDILIKKRMFDPYTLTIYLAI